MLTRSQTPLRFATIDQCVNRFGCGAAIVCSTHTSAARLTPSAACSSRCGYRSRPRRRRSARHSLRATTSANRIYVVVIIFVVVGGDETSFESHETQNITQHTHTLHSNADATHAHSPAGSGVGALVDGRLRGDDTPLRALLPLDGVALALRSTRAALDGDARVSRNDDADSSTSPVVAGITTPSTTSSYAVARRLNFDILLVSESCV